MEKNITVKELIDLLNKENITTDFATKKDKEFGLFVNDIFLGFVTTAGVSDSIDNMFSCNSFLRFYTDIENDKKIEISRLEELVDELKKYCVELMKYGGDFNNELSCKIKEAIDTLKDLSTDKELEEKGRLIKSSLSLGQKVFCKHRGKIIKGEVISIIHEDDKVQYRIKYYKDDTFFPCFFTFLDSYIGDFIFLTEEEAKNNYEMSWINTFEVLPLDNILVEIKLYDGLIIVEAVFRDSLWFLPDKNMYLHYTPEYWRYIVS